MSILLIKKFLDLINFITSQSKIVDLIFLYFLFLSGNNFPMSPSQQSPSKLSIRECNTGSASE